MADISKITGIAIASVAKVYGVAIANISKVIGNVYASFANTQDVSRSLTGGTAQSVYLADSNASGIEFDQDDAYTISFWIKAGWSDALNANIFLFGSSDVGGGINDDTFRMYYGESNNRLNIQWRSSNTDTRHQFWLFHTNSGVYADSYAAAGLGATYWSATNRGNVGDDDYTLITFTKGASNSAANSNVSLYWNGTSCGTGHYASGNNAGTPAMGNNNKQVFLGSKSYSPYDGAGNSAETKYDGLTIWNKKLTATEVAELYNSGTPMDATSHSAATNLKGYWEFEVDGTATVGENMTVNGNSNIDTR
jgi:hypothetical protein